MNILRLYSEIKLMVYMCILHMLTTPNIYKYIKSHTEWNLEHKDQSNLWVFLPRNRRERHRCASHILEAGHEPRPQKNRSSHSPDWELVSVRSWGVTQLNPALYGKADKITTMTTNQ